ncbi:MAG: tRNA uridine-5-carboxymethylaminomethyl(34) synthesis GTPase MnmE [Gemmatimonadota bacterium]
MEIDTIASVSTAPGVGAIAVIRLSGPQALEVLEGLTPRESRAPESRRATLLELRDPEDGELLDRAVVTVFREPASYTGEDMVELSCHGGRLVPDLVLDACVRAGARRAEPGEFTRRAYLRGKLDLVQVEAVADLIDARSRALHRAALGQLDRGLSARIGELRDALVGLEAVLAHHIDFPEEDDAPVPVEDIGRRAEGLVRDLDQLLATAPEGELLREGAVTVLAGRPNVGKSSLFNALAGEERAIVTEIAGTTRDALEVVVQLGGFPFRLVDTAGLREAGETVERIGIEVTHRYLGKADLVLFCVSSAEELSSDEEAFLDRLPDVPVVLVETKVDLTPAAEPLLAAEGAVTAEVGAVERAGGASGGTHAHKLRLSARTGQGLDQLRQLLPELVYSAVVSVGTDVPVLTRRRHARGLERAREEVGAFRRGLEEGLPPEVAAAHLLPAKTALEEILGVISVEDVLDAVFAEFCVGK